MKKLVFFAFVLLAISSLPAQKGKLSVLSFTDELSEMLDKYYKLSHKDVQIQYSLTPSDQFQSKLDPMLASGRNTPDVFSLEASFVKKYVESGQLLDLTEIYERNKSKLLAYPVEVGTYNGKVYALSWENCAGAMFYRRSLAKKYLGTDDPAAVQAFFSNPGKFLETAKLLNQKSGGKCVVVPGYEDLFLSFLGARKQPWIVNGKLVIDPIMEQYLDFSKTLYDKRWDGHVGQWSEGWFNGMQGRLWRESPRGYYDDDENETKDFLEVFSYFLPAWGLRYVLKTNAPNTAGDWAMIPGPAPFYWSGTWLGAYKNTKNKKAALEMIEWFTVNDGFLEQWAKDTGDIVTNTVVVNKIKNNYSEPYIGGQNYYAEFSNMAKNVNGKLIQSTDEVINNLFKEEVYSFVYGEKTRAQALADFRSQIESQFGVKSAPTPAQVFPIPMQVFR